MSRDGLQRAIDLLWCALGAVVLVLMVAYLFRGLA